MMFRFIVVLTFSIGLLSCSHLTRVDDIKPADESRVVSVDVPYGAPSVVTQDSVDWNRIPTEIPHEMNEHVQKWMDYFQGRGRKHMTVYLERSTKYLELMKEILKDNGLPEDLIYVVMIESGFSSKARSHASAVGYWQFIRGTAKRYGLRVDHWVDQRRDPVLATQAAANYLKGLYHVFQSWHLALASYNAGENRVKSAVMRVYTRDFWDLVEGKRLPTETLNYVPKFLAAREIAKNPEKYGFVNIDYEKPLQFSKVNVDKTISLRLLAKNMGISYSDLSSLNPSYLRDVASISARSGEEIRVPLGMEEKAVAAVAKSYSTSQTPTYVASSSGSYRVKRGDTLSGIAERFKTTVTQLRRLNNLGKRSFIRAGQKLTVNVNVPSASEQIKTISSKLEDGRYRVRWGDNLYSIAKKYGTSVAKLKQLNNFDRRHVLKAGTYIQVEERNPASQTSSGVESEKGAFHHRVKRGESLYALSKKYGVSVGQLQQANQLSRRSFIRVGQILVIPGRSTKKTSNQPIIHIVRRGDTLTDISKKYNVPIQKITSKNNLSRRAVLYVGTELEIPISSF